MITIISEQNIQAINTLANTIIALLKAEKVFFSSEYRSDERIKASHSLLEISRAYRKDYRFAGIKTAEQKNADLLETHVNALAALLENKTQNMCHKLKDFSGDIKPKLCRELVSELEVLLITGEIDYADINEVYAALNKPLPKKFKGDVVTDENRSVYNAISKAIAQGSQDIKANSVQHYIDIVNRIDPNDEIDNKKAFVNACREKISDITTLMLTVACKFSSDKFQDMINDAFDNLVVAAACRITEKYRGESNTPVVDVRDIHIGGKGFDLKLTLDDQFINARAVPVDGYFVRFHYRYLVN